MGWAEQAKKFLERERNEYRDTQNKIKVKSKTQVAENQNSNVENSYSKCNGKTKSEYNGRKAGDKKDRYNKPT